MSLTVRRGWIYRAASEEILENVLFIDPPLLLETASIGLLVFTVCNKYIQDGSDCEVILVYFKTVEQTTVFPSGSIWQNWCCTFGPCRVSSSFSDTVIFADISLRMVPGISPFLPHAVACHPAPGWLPALWIGPDQHSVFNTINEGSEGQNYSVHVDI